MAPDLRWFRTYNSHIPIKNPVIYLPEFDLPEISDPVGWDHS